MIVGLATYLTRLFASPRNDPDRIAGDAARDRGDWAQAAVSYKRYLRRRPGHQAVWLRLGNMLKELGRYDEADDAYQTAVRCDPSNSLAHRLRGDLQRGRGDHKAAAAAYFLAWETGRDSAAGLALTRPEQIGNLARVQQGAALKDRITGGIDGLRDLRLEGWAWNPTTPDDPVIVDVWIGGVCVGSAHADHARPDIADAKLAPERCGFVFDLGPFLADVSDRSVVVMDRSSGRALAGSPFDLGPMAGLTRWLQRERGVPGVPGSPLISIITPVHDVRLDWFDEAAVSVRDQTDGRWEWILVDDGSSDTALKQRLAALAQADSRIKLVSHQIARGTAAATNAGIRVASADYILFLDHDDALEVEAVERFVEASAQGGDLIYGDEAVCGGELSDLRMLVARPAFSWRYYLSHPYFVHPICVRRTLALEGFDETLSISADVDFVLRILERASAVTHVPGILYRWRTHDQSLGHSAREKVSRATTAAIERHLDRLGIKATVFSGASDNTYRVDFDDPGGRILIVIPTQNKTELLRKCIHSIKSTTQEGKYKIVVIDHDSDEAEMVDYLSSQKPHIDVVRYRGDFNYSRMNNQAFSAYAKGHDFVLFLNNDVEAISSGWLERMRALAAMADVGAVGAILLYPNRQIQHAGVVVGLGGYAEHAMKFCAFERDGQRNTGYNNNLSAIRDWSAVTGACMMMRTDVFRDIGGFDEDLPVGFNDTDLCLRIRERGLSVLTDNAVVLKHHESLTRNGSGHMLHPRDAERFADHWRHVLEQGDPFYSPVLSRERDHSPEHPDSSDLIPRTISVKFSAISNA